MEKIIDTKYVDELLQLIDRCADSPAVLHRDYHHDEENQREKLINPIQEDPRKLTILCNERAENSEPECKEGDSNGRRESAFRYRKMKQRGKA
jgi:hypothetical protein